MYKTLEVSVDTERKSSTQQSLESFAVNTNDYESVKLLVKLTQDKEPVNLSGATVKLAIRKPDRNIIYQNGEVVLMTQGHCEFELETQSYNVAGAYVAEVMIYFDNGQVVASRAFSYQVVQGILSDAAVESTSWYQDINALQQAVADLEIGLNEEINQAMSEATAEANAAATNATQAATLANQRVTELDGFETSITSQLAETAKSIPSVFTAREGNSIADLNVTNFKMKGGTKILMPNSPYGNDEFVHPDVIYFKNGWNGWKYWMVVTPYRAQKEEYENPCIYVSNDMQNWSTPAGLNNPLYPYPGGVNNYVHYSDPCWILDKDGKTLHFVTRMSGAGTNNVYFMSSSTDGINWSSQIEIARFVGRELVSPEIIYTFDKYYMYYIDATDAYKLKRMESDDLLSWTNEVTCTATGSSAYLWHIDIVQYGGGLLMFVNTLDNQKTLLYKSRDFTNFSLSSSNVLNASTVNANVGVYKPSIVLQQDDSGIYFNMIYNIMGDPQDTDTEKYTLHLTKKYINKDINTSYSPVLGYINGSGVFTPIVTTSVGASFNVQNNLCTFSFDLTVSDLTGADVTKPVLVKLPYFGHASSKGTTMLEVLNNGTIGPVLYGYINGADNNMFIKKISNGAVVFVSELSVGTRIRGSITYLTNMTENT